MQKIIFLDIDGPMIPSTSFLMDTPLGNPSYEQILDDRCVMVLHKIIKDTGAKIVFNTTHNQNLYSTDETSGGWLPGLVGQFEKAGFKDHIHQHNCTKYPHYDRLTCIKVWLRSQPIEEDIRWVALDDVKMLDKRCYLVNEEYGIGISAYEHCLYWLNEGGDIEKL